VAAVAAGDPSHPPDPSVAAVAVEETSHPPDPSVAAVEETSRPPDPSVAAVEESTFRQDPLEAVEKVIPGMGAFTVVEEETATLRSEHTTHHPSEAIQRPTEDRTCPLPNRILNQGIRTGKDHGNLRTDRRKGRTLIPHAIIRAWVTDKSGPGETTISTRIQGPIFNMDETTQGR